jgi:serine protease Do
LTLAEDFMRALATLLLPVSLCLLLTSRPAVPAQETTPAAAGKGLARRVQSRRTPVVELIERVKGAVVNIHSERTVKGPAPATETAAVAPSQSRINGMGTGIIIDPRGYIVTNYHVVEDVNVIRVKLSDGTAQNALVLARSHDADLALLKISVARPLPTMPLGTAQDLMVGETVVAIGNPYGYEHTVSQGVVSAIKRDVSLNKEMSYRSLIQTDASINPGNSGGPLLNINGELIGVNVAIRAGAQGIGFAIPVEQMIRVVGEMLRARRRQAGYDGLVCRDRLEQGSDGLVRKVLVERAESDSPAAAAGLRQGDVLVRVGEVQIACSYDVERALLDRQPGERVPLVVRRQGGEQKAELVLQPATRNRPGSADVVWRKLGLRLAGVEGDLVARINRQLHGGLEVVAVEPDGAASRAGIRRGDILVGLHQWETLSVDNVAYVLTHPDLATFNPLSFHIVRGGQIRRGWMQQVD